MKTLRLRSPAKLNLFLKVLNKRNDGYHNLLTLFERIDLYDDIHFRRNTAKTIKIICNDPQVPLGSKNLAYRAAKLLQDECEAKYGATIRITKRIPVAAGLAGGSSNAATTLLGLSKIWGLSLSSSKILSYGKKIGADVPFFLHNCSFGLGTKKGDEIKKLPLRTKLWHILVVPRVKMSTPRVFKGLKVPKTNVLTKPSDSVNILIHHLRKSNISKLGPLVRNDLEPRVFRLCPNLTKLKKSIEKLDTIGVALSGSGPSIFGLTMTRKQAEDLKPILMKRYSRVYVIRTL